MTIDKGIIIHNIYYMLSYAFKVLEERQYESIKSEKFDNIFNLCAAILFKGVSKQLKQGLYQSYVPEKNNLTSVRGKINVSESIKLFLNRKKLLSCEYDDFSVDNIFNQILKMTLLGLLNIKNVNRENKTNLKILYGYFNEVSDLDNKYVDWKHLNYQKNNQTYRMLMSICYFIWHDLLYTTEKGEYNVMSFTEETMSRLYEKFVLEYYKKHFNALSPESSCVDWDLMGTDNSSEELLPVMHTDIFLKNKDNGKVLIIDTKYYKETLSTHFGKNTYNSNNLYQVFTYVKNYDKENNGKTSGMLLYAKTQEPITVKAKYNIGGNDFYIDTLDLSVDFEEIRKKLDSIVEKILY